MPSRVRRAAPVTRESAIEVIGVMGVLGGAALERAMPRADARPAGAHQRFWLIFVAVKEHLADGVILGGQAESTNPA
ncbi:hypothetical protein [Nonomuraea sp. CA-141351]|uniref:hypothetical protein n=1 Tax=Nonomuraea sp. CA-141351 TaxID=3239996 RepID=UPI003D913459